MNPTRGVYQFNRLKMSDKIIIYQVFTRLFGNDRTNCKHNGTKKGNGCGHFSDFTLKALQEIKNLGSTHIWYTGVIEHATQTNYEEAGITPDHPAIVKGKAGSPYAIKDYYDIDPDLADKPKERMKEFENLVARTHKAGLKFIIDFVPNHVARQYKSDNKPLDVKDLGEDDNKQHAFNQQNNFYYIPDQLFYPNFDLKQDAPSPYYEMPARATGNDNFSSSPNRNDWYETIKLNYGVDYCGGRQCHFQPTPSTWLKMRDILLYWSSKGIDGFRCDMAEMVPVEFWGWVIPIVKEKYPDIIFIAEVYNPNEYRNYIYNGKFDYLYDKVGLYDTLRGVMCGYTSARQITACWQSVDDIKTHMLNFLENHDEQRIASDFFAKYPEKGKAGLIVSACMSTNPMMIYFGQELGERGMDEEGFSGLDGRTTIFDYWTVDTIRRWRNKGKFDNSLLTDKEKELKAYYSQLLNLCNKETAIKNGEFYDLMYVNESSEHFNADKNYVFIRKSGKELILVIANFEDKDRNIGITLPKHLFDLFEIKEQKQVCGTDLLTGKEEVVSFNSAQRLMTHIPANGGKLLKIEL